jgi:uncharacterized protein with PIN domain
MESADQTVSLERIADLVVERLTQSGALAGLESASLDEIEGATIVHLDQITREVITQLLGKQARLIEPPQRCPQCGGEVGPKPAQTRSLQSQRGQVHFQTEVVHCEACRLDFFPSVQNSGM